MIVEQSGKNSDGTVLLPRPSVYEMSKKTRVHNRLSPYMVSVSRVAEACKIRGWV